MWLTLLMITVAAAACFATAAVWLSRDESGRDRSRSMFGDFTEGCCAAFGANALAGRAAVAVAAPGVGAAAVPQRTRRTDDPTLLPRRMERLGIDAVRIARTEPMLLRGLVLRCRRCRSAERCTCDLRDASDRSDDWKAFCSNAAMLRVLAASTR